MDFGAANQARGFHHFTGSVAFHRRLGVFHFAHDDGGQFHGNRVAFVEGYFAVVVHAVHDEFQRIADVVGFNFVLVEFIVHEHIHWVGKIAVFAVFAVQDDNVEFIVCFHDGFAVRAGEQVFQFHGNFGRRAAAFDVFGFLHHHRVVANHKYVAGA